MDNKEYLCNDCIHFKVCDYAGILEDNEKCEEHLSETILNKPKKGKWRIVKDEKYGDNVKCPFCGKELAGTDLNFCCKCGADMREADND